MIDEGYIKFSLDWKKGPAPDAQAISSLIQYREILFHSGLIGWDAKENVGYGNISCRNKNATGFYISGTQTGGIERTLPEHYTAVTHWSIESNYVECIGPLPASSESLTHAAIYASDPSIQSVIHIHHIETWNRILFRLPSTPEEAHYGTPAMAIAIADIVKSKPALPVAVMTGHLGGILSWGKDFETAIEPLQLEGLIKS